MKISISSPQSSPFDGDRRLFLCEVRHVFCCEGELALIKWAVEDPGLAGWIAQPVRVSGHVAAITGGDLLGMIKKQLVAPNVLIHLKEIKGLDPVMEPAGSLQIGGHSTPHAFGSHPLIRSPYTVLATNHPIHFTDRF